MNWTTTSQTKRKVSTWITNLIAITTTCTKIATRQQKKNKETESKGTCQHFNNTLLYRKQCKIEEKYRELTHTHTQFSNYTMS